MTDDAEPLRSVYDYAVAYAQAGFSVIPVPRGQKGATIRWANYQKAVADPSQLVKWFNVSDPPNVAIIMGQVSGNAVALDVDHAGFAAFLEEQVLPTFPASVMPLCKRTGSGKLHIIVRSVEPISTTILTQRGTGHTLADIKAEGGYVIAAPSIHPSGGSYRILRGTLDFIPKFQNARTFFDKLEGLYAQYLGTDPNYLLTPKMQIHVPVEGEDRIVLEKEIKALKLGARIQRAILQGAYPGDGDWANQPSHSEIDFAIVIALREKDWSPERIETVFATFPIGEGCYRNAQRADHGTPYLALTCKKADKRLASHPTNQEQAQGADWQILDVVRTEFDPPRFEMVIRCPDGVERKLQRLLTEDILSDRKMQAKLAALFSSVPKFRAQHQGRGYTDFANGVLEIANRENVPTLATGSGFLQSLLLELLKSANVRKYKPEAPDDLGAGWLDDERIHLRGRSAIRFIEQRVKGTVTTEEVWEAARALGAKEGSVSPFEGHTERVWTLPSKLLG